MGFLYFLGTNFLLTFMASILCVCFAPTAAGPGIPEIKAYLNGVDTPNMYGATTLFVKVSLLEEFATLLSIFFNTMLSTFFKNKLVMGVIIIN